ncbi:hypothetical protein E2C01_025670 [Portunus trituberculatus]|uniref:Uncharacterized protein n=1 Tax=Portunus trituberculatus TaxID=210409 RepID=A0A5B7EDJ5_PORTR|nr:hypothetical protein [Portunus trituberculatus]
MTLQAVANLKSDINSPLHPHLPHPSDPPHHAPQHPTPAPSKAGEEKGKGSRVKSQEVTATTLYLEG